LSLNRRPATNACGTYLRPCRMGLLRERVDPCHSAPQARIDRPVNKRRASHPLPQAAFCANRMNENRPSFGPLEQARQRSARRRLPHTIVGSIATATENVTTTTTDLCGSDVVAYSKGNSARFGRSDYSRRAHADSKKPALGGGTYAPRRASNWTSQLADLPGGATGSLTRLSDGGPFPPARK
jgi:hypothetical protein